MGTESAMKPYKSGDEFKPSARWLNAVNDLLGDRAGLRRITAPQDTSVSIRVYNATGADLPRFSVVAIGDPVLTLAAQPDAFPNSKVYSGDPPFFRAMFGITQEPIADEAVGRAVILGETTCTIDVSDEAHGYADAGTSTADLVSAESGSALILWKESGTGAGKEAKVLLTRQAEEEPLTYGSTGVVGGAVVGSGGSTSVFTVSLDPGVYVAGVLVQVSGVSLGTGSAARYDASATISVTAGTADIHGETTWVVGYADYPIYETTATAEESVPVGVEVKGSEGPGFVLVVHTAATFDVTLSNSGNLSVTAGVSGLHWLKMTRPVGETTVTELTVGTTVANGASPSGLLYTGADGVLQSAGSGVRVDSGRVQPNLSAGRWLDFGEASH